MQVSTSKFTHVSRYSTFILNGILYINKNSYHHIKKTTLVKRFLIRTIIFFPLFLYIYRQVVIPHCQGGSVGVKPHHTRTMDQFFVWYNSPPDNLLVERDIIQTRFSVLFETNEVIFALNFWHIFKIPVINLS